MEKTQKKIFGFFGLVLVVAMTFIAASLPSSETSAISTVTDTLTVRVVSSSSDVNLTSPESGMVTTSAEQTFRLNYANVNTVTLLLTKTDLDGTTHTFTLAVYDTDYGTGEKEYNINLQNAGYGYGEYVITLQGEGASGLSDEDSVAFSYYPVVADATEDENTGETVLNFDYEAYDPSNPGGTGEVAEIEINVYDENENLVEELSPIKVAPPETSVVIPFNDYDLPSGTYTIKTTAYDKDGNELYKAYVNHVIQKKEDIPVPNTGGLFGALNISRADYLITGVIVFLLTGIFGVVFIAKRQKKTSRRR